METVDLDTIDIESLSTEAVSDVLAQCQKLETSLHKIDMNKIVIYTGKIKDIGQGFNSMLAPMYLRDFIMAYDITNIALSKATQIDLQLDTLLNTAESIAYLDKAKVHLVSRDIKDSSEARKRYIPVDPDVIKVANLKAKAAALVAFLKNKLIEFRFAHDDVKKIAYFNSDSQNEGM